MSNRLAIEIGGTKLQAAVGTPDGRILRRGRRSVPEGARAEDICRCIAEMAVPLVAGERLGRVGIGFGGPVDSPAGRVVRSFHVGGWDGFALGDWAEKTFTLPAVVENDTNCGALAEARAGAGRGGRVVFYTNIGTGIGGGLVIDGTLYNGRYGACEIGHTRLFDPATGRYVILERLCSGLSIARIARERAAAGRLARVLALAGAVEGITAEHVGHAAAEGDPQAAALVGEVAGNFAVALCNVIALLNPDRVIVGGGVSLMGEAFFGPLRSAVAAGVFPPYADNYRILPAALGEDVVLVGALMV